MTTTKRNIRLREDMDINWIGQKDLKKLYWEREQETLVDETYRTQVANHTFSRHTGK